jgi:protease-4
MLRSSWLTVALLAACVTNTSVANAAGKTVPVFTFSGAITEAPVAQDILFGSLDTASFREIIARFDKAAADDKVAGVVIFLEGAELGHAQREELRQAMARLRAAGKPMYAHGDSLMTGGYALLSGVDRLSMTPTGYLFITGLYGESPYIRGLLDILGVEPDFLACGDYKSAGEMFMRSGPSDEAAAMYKWLYDGIYDRLLAQIAEGRGVEVDQARTWIDGGLYSAETALTEKLIDAVEHRHEFVAHIQAEHGEDVVFDKKYGQAAGPQVDLNNPFEVMQLYMQLLTGPTPKRYTKDSVAVIYVEGAIYPGSAEPTLFGATGGAYSDPIRKAIDQAAEDKTIKAVVLRIDSPGGSAVASEVILQATQRLAATKPLIISMGNTAASGGYYVALGSKIIYADPSTVTGSIGVVSGKIATTQMWNRIGITFHPIQRGARSGLLGSAKVFSDEERTAMQSWMDEVYVVFKQHVVDARGDKLSKPIDEIAGGRVYTGQQAKDLGLVDELGDLSAAIARAADEADIEKYEVRVVPEPENPLEALLGDLSGQSSDEPTKLSLPAGVSRPGSLWDAAMPLLKGLDPERVQLLHSAFDQLEMIEREQVIMALPVMNTGFAN